MIIGPVREHSKDRFVKTNLGKRHDAYHDRVTQNHPVLSKRLLNLQACTELQTHPIARASLE